MRRFYSGIAVAAAAMILSACGGSSSANPNAPASGAALVPTVIPTGSGNTTAPVGNSPTTQSLPAVVTSQQTITGSITFSGLSTNIGNATNVQAQISTQTTLPTGVPALNLPNNAQVLLYVTVSATGNVTLSAPPDFRLNVGSTTGNQYFIADYDSSTGSWDNLFYTTHIDGGSGNVVDDNPGGSFSLTSSGFTTFALYSLPIVPTAQAHVMTADYLGPIVANAATGLGGSTSVAPQQAAASLTWAEVRQSTQAVTKAAGIKTLFGMQPMRQAPGDPLYTTDESTFAHYQNCAAPTSADRITFGATNLYVMSRNANLGVLWKNYITSVFASNPYDAVLEIGDGPLSTDSLNPHQLPCGYGNDAAWDALDASMENSLGFPVVDDALSAFQETGGTWNPSPSLTDLNATTVGGMEEQCYSSDSNSGVVKLHDSLWIAAENTELTMARNGKTFFCYPRNLTAASTAQDIRSYVYASFLLTYDPATSVLWDIFATPSSYHVEPESTLVALDPVKDAPTDISGLKRQNGLYVREYRRCYVAGNFVGSCASVVNSDSTSHPYQLGAKYNSVLQLNGGGIADGGTVTLASFAPPATVAPLTGLVLVHQH